MADTNIAVQKDVPGLGVGTPEFKEAVERNKANRATSTRKPDEDQPLEYGKVVEVDELRRMEYSTILRMWEVYSRATVDARWLPVGSISGSEEEALKYARSVQIAKE